MNSAPRPQQVRQHGAAVVEFAMISLIFFTLLFGALELARMMYIYNTLQEVTRRAAREMTVRWITQEATVKTLALFGSASLPGGAMIDSSSINIEYLTADGNPVTVFPSDPSDNLSACGDATRTASCIYSVRVTINPTNYSPMLSLFSAFNIAMPGSSVTMHAESMGFES